MNLDEEDHRRPGYGRDYNIKMDLITGMGGKPGNSITASIKSDEFLQKLANSEFLKKRSAP